MFLDIVDMATTYFQYLSLLLRLSPDSLPSFYDQPFSVLKYLTLDTYQVTQESERYNNPLRIHLPVWLPLDLRLQYVCVAIIAPLALATFGLLAVYGKIAYVWMLLLLGTLFMFIFGFALLADPSSFAYPDADLPSTAALGVLGGVGLSCFLLVLTLGLLCMGLFRLRQLRCDAAEMELMIEEELKRRNSQRVTQSIVDRDGIDITAVAAELVHAKKQQARIDKADVADLVLQGLFVLVLVLGSFVLLGAIPIRSMAEVQKSAVFEALGAIGLVVAVGTGAWWVLSMFRGGRRLQQGCSAFCRLQILGVLLMLASTLYINVVTNFISIIYCTPTTCAAGTRLPHAASLFPTLENTSASTGATSPVGCLSCAFRDYPQRCSAAMQASLCSTAHTQSRLVYDSRVPCESVDGFYRVGGALMFMFYLIFLPYLQFYVAQYGVRVLQDVYPLQRRYYDVFTPAELYYQKVLFSNNSAAFTYRAYRPRFRFYRLSFLLQKIVLGIVGCIMRRGQQSDIAWVGMIFFLVVPLIALACSLVLRPFMRPAETLFFPATQAMVAVCSVVCLVAQHFGRTKVPAAVWALLMVCLVAVPLLALVVGEVLSLRDERRWGDMLQLRLVEGVTTAYAAPDGPASSSQPRNPLHTVASGIVEAPTTVGNQQQQQRERGERGEAQRGQSEPLPGRPRSKVEDSVKGDDVEMLPLRGGDSPPRRARNPLLGDAASGSRSSISRSSGSRSNTSGSSSSSSSGSSRSRSLSLTSYAATLRPTAAAAGAPADGCLRHRSASLPPLPRPPQALNGRHDAAGRPQRRGGSDTAEGGGELRGRGERDSAATSVTSSTTTTTTSSGSGRSGRSAQSLVSRAAVVQENSVQVLLQARTWGAILRAMCVIAVETIAAPFIMLYHDHRERRRERQGQPSRAGYGCTGGADDVVVEGPSGLEASLGSVRVSAPASRAAGPALLRTAPLFQRTSTATRGVEAVRAEPHRAKGRATATAAAQPQPQPSPGPPPPSSGQSPGQSRRDGGGLGGSWGVLPGLTLPIAAAAANPTSGGGSGARRRQHGGAGVPPPLGAGVRSSLSLSASPMGTGFIGLSPSQSLQGLGSRSVLVPAKGGQQQLTPTGAAAAAARGGAASLVYVPPSSTAAGAGNNLELSLSLQQHRQLTLPLSTATAAPRTRHSGGGGSRDLSLSSDEERRRARRLTGDAVAAVAAVAALASDAAGEYARESTEAFVPSLYFMQHAKSTWWAARALPYLRRRSATTVTNPQFQQQPRQHRSPSQSRRRHRGASGSMSSSGVAAASTAAAGDFRRRISMSLTRLLAGVSLPWQRTEAGRGEGSEADDTEAQRVPLLQPGRHPAAAAAAEAASSSAAAGSAGTLLSNVTPPTASYGRHRNPVARRDTDRPSSDRGVRNGTASLRTDETQYSAAEPAPSCCGGDGVQRALAGVAHLLTCGRCCCCGGAGGEGEYREHGVGGAEKPSATRSGGGAVLSFTEVYVRRQVCARSADERGLARLCTTHELQRRRREGDRCAFWGNPTDAMLGVVDVPGSMPPWSLFCSAPVPTTAASDGGADKHPPQHRSMASLQQQYYAQLVEEQQARRAELQHSQARIDSAGGSFVKKRLTATQRADGGEVLKSDSLLISPVYTSLAVTGGFQLPRPQDPVLVAANEYQAQAVRLRQDRGPGLVLVPLDSEMQREQDLLLAHTDADYAGFHGGDALLIDAGTPRLPGDEDDAGGHGGGGATAGSVNWLEQWGPMLTELLYEAANDSKHEKMRRRERRERARWQRGDLEDTSSGSSSGGCSRSRGGSSHSSRSPTPSPSLSGGGSADRNSGGSRPSSRRRHGAAASRSTTKAGRLARLLMDKLLAKVKPASSPLHRPRHGARGSTHLDAAVRRGSDDSGGSTVSGRSGESAASGQRPAITRQHSMLLSLITGGLSRHGSMASITSQSRTHGPSAPGRHDSGGYSDEGDGDVASPHLHSGGPRPATSSPEPRHRPMHGASTTPASASATATPGSTGARGRAFPATAAAAALPPSEAEPDGDAAPDPLIQKLRCLFLVRQRLKESYWEHRDQLTSVQTYVDYEINAAVRHVLTSLFIVLGLIATLALALATCGMLHTVDWHFIDGTQLEHTRGVTYELAGYSSWESFTSGCCCMAATNATASYPYYAIDVEDWVCDNGITKERVRRDGYNDDVVDGYSVRPLCGMAFSNGCSLAVDPDADTVALVGCDSAVVTDEAKLRW